MYKHTNACSNLMLLCQNLGQIVSYLATYIGGYSLHINCSMAKSSQDDHQSTAETSSMEDSVKCFEQS